MIKIGDLLVDASLSESHQREAEITEFPVEAGSDITDNVVIKPTEVTVRGLVSDSPLADAVRAARASISTTPREDARARLEAIFEARQPVTIATELKTYDNMVMQSLTVDLERDSGFALPFTAVFRQIIVATNKRVIVRAVAIAQPKVNRGNLYGKPPGWIGTDKQGRDIIAKDVLPGADPQYYKSDGTRASVDEARAAAARNDAVIVKYDKDGHAVPVADQDYAPYTPKQKKPFWAPTSAGVGGK